MGSFPETNKCTPDLQSVPHCTYYDIHEGVVSGGRGNGKHCVCQLLFNYIMIPVSIGNSMV